MKPTVIRDFLTGATALVGLAGLVIMLILFGEMANFTQKNYRFYVTVTTAAGLADSSPVTLNGVKVGQIIEAKVAEPPASGARLRVRIRQDTPIPRGAKVSVNQSLVGDASLEFTIPAEMTTEQRADTVKDGDTLVGGDPGGLFAKLGQSLDEPLKKLSRTADSIDELARTYTDLGNRLKDVVEPRTLADLQAGKAPNLRTTIERLDVALTGANRWLADDQLLGETKKLVEKANGVVDQASTLATEWTATAKDVRSTVSNIDSQVNKLAPKADEAVAQATTTLRTAETAAAKLADAIETMNKGQGTMGQLMQNPDLYNSLNDSAKRLDAALSEFQLLVEKLRKEGIPLKL
jgi:phospholipid/cholesterol/gamma-HCH transport system substrate-binding protein